MVNREGELNKGTSIQARHIKSRFLLMPALARDTMWFTTSAVAYLSARAVITFGEMTLDITSSASRQVLRRVVSAEKRALEPATPTVKATAQNDNDENDNQKSGGVHG